MSGIYILNKSFLLGSCGVVLLFLILGYLMAPHMSLDNTRVGDDRNSSPTVAIYESDDYVTSIDYDPGRNILAAVASHGKNARIEFWNCSQHKRIEIIREEGVRNVYFLDSFFLVSAGPKSGVKLWRYGDLKAQQSWPGSYPAAVCPSRKLIALTANTTDNNRIDIIPVQHNEQAKKTILEEHDIAYFSFSSTGAIAVSQYEDNHIKIYAPPYTGKASFSLVGHGSTVIYSRFVDEGNTMITLDYNDRLTFWDLMSKREKMAIQFAQDESFERVIITKYIENGIESIVHDPSFLDKTRHVRLAIESCDKYGLLAITYPAMKLGEVLLLDYKSRKVRQRFIAHTNGVADLRCICNGEILATCGMDHTIKLWRLSDIINH